MPAAAAALHPPHQGSHRRPQSLPPAALPFGHCLVSGKSSPHCLGPRLPLTKNPNCVFCLTDCWSGSGTDWLTVSLSSRCTAEGNRISSAPLTTQGLLRGGPPHSPPLPPPQAKRWLQLLQRDGSGARAGSIGACAPISWCGRGGLQSFVQRRVRESEGERCVAFEGAPALHTPAAPQERAQVAIPCDVLPADTSPPHVPPDEHLPPGPSSLGQVQRGQMRVGGGALCHGACMTNRVRCMGVTIFVSAEGTLSHAHPNALDDRWSFKFGAPLQSYWAVSTRRTTNVFLSALSNTLPFMRSWGAFLLSCAAWMQLAVLSGYPPVAVRASMSAAIHRILAKTEWDVARSLRWVVFLSPRLPQSFSDTVGDLLSWLSRSAFWSRSSYASWHLPHAGACTPFCVDWSADLSALRGLYSSLSSEPRVDWGVHRGRGATAETR